MFRRSFLFGVGLLPFWKPKKKLFSGKIPIYYDFTLENGAKHAILNIEDGILVDIERVDFVGSVSTSSNPKWQEIIKNHSNIFVQLKEILG